MFMLTGWLLLLIFRMSTFLSPETNCETNFSCRHRLAHGALQLMLSHEDCRLRTLQAYSTLGNCHHLPAGHFTPVYTTVLLTTVFLDRLDLRYTVPLVSVLELKSKRRLDTSTAC